MQPATKVQPPAWLSDEAPAALPIWHDLCERLARRNLLDAADPGALAAYAYCLSEALRFERLGPGRTSHVNPEVTVAGVWRRGAQYAANRLAPLFPIVPVSFFALLLDDIWDTVDEDGKFLRRYAGRVIYHLDPAWEVEGSDDDD